jgi:acetyl-CoA C-acetyltransferase
MNFSRQAAVVGVYEHESRWASDKTDFQIATESARKALAEAGLTIKDVDGYFVSGVSGMAPALMCDYLNIRPQVVDSTSIGGTSFLAHAAHAVSPIATGRCEVALITYGIRPPHRVSRLEPANGRPSRFRSNTKLRP